MSEVLAAENIDSIVVTPAAILGRDTDSLGRRVQSLWKASHRRIIGRQAVMVTRNHSGSQLDMRLRSGQGRPSVMWTLSDLLVSTTFDVGGRKDYAWMAEGHFWEDQNQSAHFSASLEQTLTTRPLDPSCEPETEVLKRIHVSPQDYAGVTCAMLFHHQYRGPFPGEDFRFFPEDDYVDPLFVVNAARQVLGDGTNAS